MWWLNGPMISHINKDIERTNTITFVSPLYYNAGCASKKGEKGKANVRSIFYVFKLSLVVVFFIFVLFFCNCLSFHDCGFIYHVYGNLISSQGGQPIADTKMAIENPPFEPTDETPDWSGFSYTDSEGRFYDTFGTGITWGYTTLFGVIRLGSTKGPIPPEVQTVVLAVLMENGEWRIQEISVTSAQQQKTAPAERWIDLDTVKMGF